MRPGRIKILNPSACQVVGGELEYDGFTLRAGGNTGLWTMMYNNKRDKKINKYVNRKASSNKVVQSLGLTGTLKKC